MYKYKLKDGVNIENLVIPNVGVISGGYVTSDIKIESPLLELVLDTPQAPAETYLNGVAPQAQQPATPIPTEVTAAQAPQIQTNTPQGSDGLI